MAHVEIVVCHLHLYSFCDSFPGSYGGQMGAKCLLVPMAGSQKEHTNHSGMVWQTQPSFWGLLVCVHVGVCVDTSLCWHVINLNLISRSPDCICLLGMPEGMPLQKQESNVSAKLLSAIRNSTSFVSSDLGASNTFSGIDGANTKSSRWLDPVLFYRAFCFFYLCKVWNSL